MIQSGNQAAAGGSGGSGNVTTVAPFLTGGAVPYCAGGIRNIQNSTLYYNAPHNYDFLSSSVVGMHHLVMEPVVAPAVAAGGALVGGSATLISGHDMAGVVKCVFGSVPHNGVVFTLTFNDAYLVPPVVLITNVSAWPALVTPQSIPFADIITTPDPTAFIVKITNTTGWAGNTIYLSYFCIGGA